MIKKVRKPNQARVKTTAQTTRNLGPSGLIRNKKKSLEVKETTEIPKDELINIDDIILE